MRRLAAGLLLASALAGCGGGGDIADDGPRLTAAEYRTKADAICTDVRTRADALELPRSLDFFPAYANKLLPIIDDGNRRLDDLRPPDELAGTADEWSEARAARRESLAELRDAALESDQQRFDEVRDDGNEHDAHADELARELGLQACGAA